VRIVMPKRWSDLKAELAESPEARAAYDRARIAHAFGAGVRLSRERAGLTQAELARLIGTSQPAIARLEAGGTQPTLETIASLSRALGTTFLITPTGVESANAAP
jgi:HTH-type transcriptional regulator/antitoxin HipB